MLLDFSGILPAEAELMYINEVERLDGFGQEIFPVKVAYPLFSLAWPSQNGADTWKTSVDSSRPVRLGFLTAMWHELASPVYLSKAKLFP